MTVFHIPIKKATAGATASIQLAVLFTTCITLSSYRKPNTDIQYLFKYNFWPLAFVVVEQEGEQDKDRKYRVGFPFFFIYVIK